MYSFRLENESKVFIHDLFKNTFEGSHSFHNYTRKNHGEGSTQRSMIKLQASEYIYINQNSLEISHFKDPHAIEFVQFHLIGQAFLYNQIRKMVGSII